MPLVLPRVAYSIFLACAFGGCSPDEDQDTTKCVCKPAMNMVVETAVPENHSLCNNATFDWMVHLLLVEIASQKDKLAEAQIQIDQLHEQVNSQDDEYRQLEEIHAIEMEMRNDIQDQYVQLQEENRKLQAESDTARQQLESMTCESKDSPRKSSPPKDCAALQQSGFLYSGLYTIYPEGVDQGLEAFCDLDTHGGGWLVIQRRQDGTQRFDRSWAEYKSGFGQLAREFWLGNEYIHTITTSQDYELRVDILDFNGNYAYATYDRFSLEDEKEWYTLRLGRYQGTAGDAMNHHRDHPFSTKDVDNDLSRSGHCSRLFGSGGWWYVRCYDSNLNGVYRESGQEKDAIVWFQLDHTHKPLRHVSMKIRPRDFAEDHH